MIPFVACAALVFSMAQENVPKDKPGESAGAEDGVAQERGAHGTRAPLPGPAAMAKLPRDGGAEFNRLVFSKSPYLLQHARNPVDWHEWGPAAFALAESRDVPVFLSIGYSTCHWCHVMEHESFEDAEVAALMNDAFVCIKVDREERPDIDQLYMRVTQRFTGSGGWPMTVIMDAEKRPFFAGTYFPKTQIGRRPGLMQLIEGVSGAWTENRDGVLASAKSIVDDLVKSQPRGAGEMLGQAALELAENQLRSRFDAVHGGFGESRKFPVPHELRFLLRRGLDEPDGDALDMVAKTLDGWRLGGVFDQVGFGMHRYSTDTMWLLPHFEKMLYDQALCASALVEAWQVTGEARFEWAARDIFAYVTRDMTSPEGGFYSAEDADSEGEEGLSYLWSPEELVKILGKEDAAFVIARFGIEEGGNFIEEATGQKTGLSIPHLEGYLSVDDEDRWGPLREKLFLVREERIHPLKDDKVLTDWNGLMIGAFAQAGFAFDDPKLTAMARRAADFVRANLRTDKGRLLKRWRQGDAGLDGMLEDYAFLASGLLDLFRASQDPRDLAWARECVDMALAHFWDEASGGFFLSPDDGEALIVRAKDAYDGARPSGNSVMATAMMRLFCLTGETLYRDRAGATIKAFSGSIAQAPSTSTHMMMALRDLLATDTAREVVIVGELGAEDTRAMLRLFQGAAMRGDAVVVRPPGPPEDPRVAPLVAQVPYLREHRQVDGKATAYVCRGFVCQAPVNSLGALQSLLREPKPGAEPGHEFR